MDSSQAVTLDQARTLTNHDWTAFAHWYRPLAARHPTAFPLEQPPIRWLMAMRGWKFFMSVPIGELTQIGVPENAQSWYDLNITERPFMVIVGEVVTILILANLGHEAYEFIRRVRDLTEWLSTSDDWDEGQLFHIVQEYVRPTTSMHELN